MENLQLIATELSTMNYRESEGFTRDIKSKSARLVLDEANAKLAELFGLKESKTETGVYFVPFSGKVMIFDNNNMTKQEAVLDQDVSNFQILAPTKINLVKGEKLKKTFIRLNAFKIQSGAKVEEFKGSYFEDDDRYTEISIEDTNTETGKIFIGE